MKAKQNLLVVTAVSLLMGAGSASAIDMEVGIHFADYDDFDSGFGAHGQLDVIESVRLSGSYTAVDNLDALVGRAGWVLGMEEMGLEIELGAGYQFWDFEGPFEDDVYGLHGIASYQVMDEFSVQGKLEFLSFDNMDDETLVIGLGAAYDITPEISVGMDVEIYEADFLDQTFIRLGGSFRF
ncbi:hypothetical protein J2T60_002287 [Natronospira proteinivora]|uniref:Outer membrane protein beta-barrel domain-containing protein n=1 Tax=Natronospira proteinivora TaxID=1807133 RepID=A0ABT1GEA9_9GAMM|nr:outer membrane beta-barrel protein [Natronospira proteinivora]MCP1728287.1 hypothetical protein [Natronospira proteinivora]